MGSQLQAVASTLAGATRLQRSVMGASRAADGTGDYDLFLALTDRIKVMLLHHLVSDGSQELQSVACEPPRQAWHMLWFCLLFATPHT